MPSTGYDTFRDTPDPEPVDQLSAQGAEAAQAQVQPETSQMPARLRRDRREGRKGTQGKKKMSRRKKIIIIAASVVAVLLVAAGAYAYYFVYKANRNMQITDPKLNDVLQPADETKPYYVLVVGSDTRVVGQNARSDTIMLCRLDPQNKRVSILSIPRDTKVEIPGHGTQKINAAMAYGGPSGAVTAVSTFAGVPISHYVELDFTGFTDIVNSLGGVTINVPAPASYQGVSIRAGSQKLDGAHALVFVRARKSYALGDFQRAANQRTFLKAVAKQVLQAPPTQIPGLLQSASKCVGSDMSSTQMVSLAMVFRGMNADTDIYSGQVPSKTARIGKVSYVLTVQDQWADVRTKFTTGVVPFVTKENQPAVKE
ncbi:MAG: LCP family protein [Coriobacteriia bacterium]|nr:LCP family protein [Coriobacteriia bacterium]